MERLTPDDSHRTRHCPRCTQDAVLMGEIDDTPTGIDIHMRCHTCTYAFIEEFQFLTYRPESEEPQP